MTTYERALPGPCPACGTRNEHAAGCKLALGLYNRQISEIRGVIAAYLLEYHEDLGDLNDALINDFAIRYAVEHPRE